MLLRRSTEGVVAITQPRHAWLAGELARAWGGNGFDVPEPRDALICAAALHDIGWLDWERAPQFDPETGLPLPFHKVKATVHTRLWQAGVDAAGAYGALPALHISRHGVAIYDKTFDRATAHVEQVQAVDAFVARQHAFQAAETARLERNADLARWVSPEHLNLTRAFMLAVDTLSLQLCWGVDETAAIPDVPRDGGAVELTLKRSSHDEIAVSPWPFTGERLEVAVEGRLVTPVDCQRALDSALREAPRYRQPVTLLPA